jgi:hypothetical protein
MIVVWPTRDELGPGGRLARASLAYACCQMYVPTNWQKQAQLLKIYEFNTMRDVGYVLNMSPSTVSNIYHNLINARGNLEYINIYPKKRYNYRHATNNHRTRCARGLLVRGARPRRK